MSDRTSWLSGGNLLPNSSAERHLKTLFERGLDGDQAAYRRFLCDIGDLLRSYIKRQLYRFKRTEVDAEDTWAVVGDQVEELINEAFNACAFYSHFEAVVADVRAGGVGVLHTDGTAAGPPR